MEEYPDCVQLRLLIATRIASYQIQ